MNYDKIYDSIINRARNRAPDFADYTEKHRVVPMCLGGERHDNNVVVLSPEERFIAYKLLVKMQRYVNHPDVMKLWSAAMKTISTTPNNKQFGDERRANIKMVRAANAARRKPKDKPKYRPTDPSELLIAPVPDLKQQAIKKSKQVVANKAKKSRKKGKPNR